MTKRPPKAFKYQERVVAFYSDKPTRDIIEAECERTGENRSAVIRRIIFEWNVTQETPNDRNQ